MKFFTIKVKTVKLGEGEFRYDELLESVILNTPQGGLPTDQLIKCSTLYAALKRKQEEHKDLPEWDFKLGKEELDVLKNQLDSMRWSPRKENLATIAEFISSIKDAKESDL